MTHAIGYFTASPQAQNLVMLFGENLLELLPPIDKAALLAILGLFLYYDTLAPTGENFELAALDAIHTDSDETTENLAVALTSLEGIDRQGAIGVFNFITQEG